ncbi:DUF2911 domain-containing protein [Winogradskyella psychrotolerans]|uniref:DUF2911 domain-containing protein n=1 Tax=Winogradskyella TaxID=286104 RepID=UPI001C07BCAC|nr:DUF2911 domain-containing protein [Winogradskyella psychrotolerans]MBU2922410.1 DUF2911 domain-containing protein [Winogradskyella psychrotolerans]|eukprot:TRINITY_DN5563_c0_g3_i1.p2 TRINITY_DN5563_c0_g3~~TRINITY_DN5563_c0_g3_i1.p2  ORF type:complete len:182 (+),score=45.36 TRINITY_DN5563_c0_g3_i1:106-651(+)
MKKSNLMTSIAFAFLMLFTFNVGAQEFKGLDKSPMDVAAFPSNYKDSNKIIKIAYSRPQLNNRSVGELVKNGEVWRTGANEAAEITLYKDLMFGNKEIKAGTYTFYVIPGKEEWTAIISTDLNVWGSYSYNEKNDVARLKVPVTEAKESLEAFSIAFNKSDNGINMHLGWGTVRVAVPFKG